MTEREEAQAKEIAEKDRRIALLEQKIDLLVRQIYGRQSEKLDPGQLDLLLNDGEEELPGKTEASAGSEPEAEAGNVPPNNCDNRPKKRRPRIPEDLPIKQEVLDPDCVKGCPEAWRLIGEEVSDQLDYQPGRFFCRRLIRRKYVKRSEPEKPPIIAPLPPKLVERGVAAPGLLAHIAISKFCDHLPLYRQQTIFDTRHDIALSRQTMSRWMGDVADWLRPIYQHIGREMLQSGYLQVDETPIKYLQPGTGKAQQGYLWTYHAPGGDTLYDWQPSRASPCLSRIIPEDFNGTIQCDGYSAYQTFAAKHGGIQLAGCWAHARRKFFDAKASGGIDALTVLREIQKLYHIETVLRDTEASHHQRWQVRQQQSLPIIEALYQRLDKMVRQRTHLPQSAMGKAISYCLKLSDMLLVYTDDGRLEIDNNLVENAIRPTAVGKKNWLFIGREETGWRSAVIYSVLGSCKNRGVEPFSYLKEVLEILPKATNWQVKDLTPAAWAKGGHHKVLQSVA